MKRVTAAGRPQSPATAGFPPAFLLIEGLSLGPAPARTLPRDLVLAVPGRPAISWRLLPESRWEPPPAPANPAAGDPLPPDLLCAGLAAACAGHRVFSLEAKETAEYLRLLFAAAGAAVPFTVVEPAELAREAQVGHVFLDKMRAIMAEVYLARGLAAAASAGADLLGTLARNARLLGDEGPQEDRAADTRDAAECKPARRPGR